MGLSMTVLLAYAVYLTLLSDHMPQTSLHVSIMSLYLNMVLGLTAAGVVMSVMVINLYFREDEEEQPSPRLVRYAVKMQHLMRWRKMTTVDVLHSTTTEANGASPAAKDYQNIASAFEKRPVTSLGQSEEPSAGPEEMKWKVVALTFDRFAFYVSSISLVVITVVFLLTLLIGSAIVG